MNIKSPLPAVGAAVVLATVTAAACGPVAPTTRPHTSATPRPSTTTTTDSPASPTGAFGDLRLGFVPANSAAKPVRPPITVALLIRPAHGGPQTVVMTISSPAVKGFQFQLSQLPPGKYRLQALGLNNADLSHSNFAVPTGGPIFTIPRSGCAYIGLISIAYYRLPPGTPKQEGAIASQVSNGKTGYFTYLKSGGLLGDTASVTIVPSAQRPPGSQSCAVHRAKF